MTDNAIKVLHVLAENYESEANCLFMWYIAERTALPQPIVRRMCRLLARKGLAKWETGLIDDDGMIAGSGYCATREGFEYSKQVPVPEVVEKSRQQELDL